MTMMMTLMNTGNCLVMVPSYARPQKVEAMKNGSSGMMILETMARTTFWISSSSASRRLDLVQVIARPTISDSASALMTFMSGGISSWNSTSGSSFRPSTCDTMDRCGMMA